MKTHQNFIIAICFGAILYSANADSRTLFTAPIFLYANQSIDCSIVNISNRERRVISEIFLSKSASEVIDMDYHDEVISPGAVSSVGAGCLENCGSVYCKFTVQGSKFFYRASACIQQSDESLNILTSCVTAE